MRPTICSLFEPHYKQNLYTNPKRTAKSSLLSINRYNSPPTCSKNIFCSKSFWHVDKNFPEVSHERGPRAKGRPLRKTRSSRRENLFRQLGVGINSGRGAPLQKTRKRRE